MALRYGAAVKTRMKKRNARCKPEVTATSEHTIDRTVNMGTCDVIMHQCDHQEVARSGGRV